MFNKIKVLTINLGDYDKNMKKTIYNIFDIWYSVHDTKWKKYERYSERRKGMGNLGFSFFCI